ncbi:leucyl/phenylalanyl-tRNA--protein transferase [Pseudidiomarina planktonica]|uniref:Leucyl/phenylalanyl-tRNA--protein transferase n=1 Tax=Pseudidiomarina planktonica TaxID=1323738 RepID=A0A1Y6EZG3_9GAMM|nr:leucyl/phenylalanyl-tRNA--protein transferase [Pseudidiomarina planktonica]SMQ65912.1 leucyl/phenylalanyl-tRNA--protein transferase [Pseudidiomarina planktonica]
MLVQLPQDKIVFPAPSAALTEPNGLLAIGGDLSPARLISAYQHGIFPWFGPDDPILWWSPDPRAVFDVDAIHISRSMRRFLRKTELTCSINKNFAAVIQKCAQVREHNEGTWISPAMQHAYQSLHELGYAHSVEVWHEQQLVGGLYGVAMGAMFCGESMFQLHDNASKLALIEFSRHFAAAGGKVIDCQVGNAHLFSLGAKPLPRDLFLHKLNILQQHSLQHEFWQPRNL